ncbi:MAG: VOC family protein [Alphaproteobacteria bacterium]|nr:VOC family protein [Alphaproteobacteria bacterium]
MDAENPSILNHVSLGASDLARSAAFYDAVMATIGATRVFEHGDQAIAYGRMFPEFWIGAPYDGGPVETANGVHVAFFARSKAEVDAFYEAALAAGAAGDGPPGPRPEYGAPYYGCFVRDPDGHKIEATYWDMALQDAG